MLTVAGINRGHLRDFLARYALLLEVHPQGSDIPGSYWGDSEAGLVGSTVHVREDTPLHSLLHESCHAICMSPERRENLHTDAGGDDLEEAAVCYLQVVLSDSIEGAGREQLMRDMDAWGYSFRLGSTARWFQSDAEDAREWLQQRGLLDSNDEPIYPSAQALPENATG